MGRGLFEHAQPVAHFTPVLICACDLRFAFDQHQDDLAVAGWRAGGFAGGEAMGGEPDISPVWRQRAFGAVDGDVVRLPCCACRFPQQIARNSIPFLTWQRC